MALSKLSFTKDWTNPNQFPTIETSEEQVRADLQDLWNQTKVGVNKIATELEATTGADQIGAVAPTGVSGTTIQALLDSLKSIIDTKAVDATVMATYETIASADSHITGVSFNESTGVFTFTRQNGTTFTIDTLLEKIATNFTYDSANQRLVLTLKDGTVQYISLSDFITETEFIDSDDIDFNVANHQVTATITSRYKDELTELKNAAATSESNAATSESNAGTYADNASASATSASTSASSSSDSATLSQSYAKGGTGSREGEATDNAKYYKEQAATSVTSAYDYAVQSGGSATLAESWAKGGTGQRAGEATNNSKYYAEKALSDGSAQATLARSYARGGTGTRDREDVDNAKYYCEQAAEIVSGQGLMTQYDYDVDATVKRAGGIKAYVEDTGGWINYIEVNGEEQTVTDKTVNIAVPTTPSDIGAYAKPDSGIPKSDLASDVQASLGKADTALQSFTETDPTVPTWAKQSSKPSYTASEVGANIYLGLYIDADGDICQYD